MFLTQKDGSGEDPEIAHVAALAADWDRQLLEVSYKPANLTSFPNCVSVHSV